MSQETITRWEAFLQKITGRYQEIVAEADAGFADLIATDAADTITYGNALTGVGARVDGLGKMMDDTFRDQVAPQLSTPEENHCQDRLDAVKTWIENDWEKRKMAHETNVYRALWPRVQAAMGQGVPCSSCGRELKLSVPYTVEAITCPGCRTVNQVAPDPVVSTYFGGAPHVFAQQAAFPKREAVAAQRVRAHEWRKVREWCDEPIELLQEYERLERDYWTTYYATVASISPMSAKDQSEYVESRMRPLYEQFERNEPAWRRFKGLSTR
ncbi:MAG TPA: hypothetical protein VF407_16485 [Polyangiaceae bacterium]